MKNKLYGSVLIAAMISTACAVAGETWQAFWIGADESTATASSVKSPEVVIEKALYGVKGDPAKQMDLKGKLQKAVDVGNFSINVGKALAGGDPAYGVEKTLELEFRVDGALTQQSLNEKETFVLFEGGENKLLPKGANQWTCFRKVLHLEKKPGRAIARMA